MQDRLFSAWIGGSIYASLVRSRREWRLAMLSGVLTSLGLQGTFQQLWVSKEAYLDDKTIVEKRCP